MHEVLIDENSVNNLKHPAKDTGNKGLSVPHSEDNARLGVFFQYPPIDLIGSVTSAFRRLMTVHKPLLLSPLYSSPLLGSR